MMYMQVLTVIIKSIERVTELDSLLVLFIDCFESCDIPP
jgi:tRNA-binding EMAP/Myf-like protein